ncbi:MAG: hypothetical protein U0452_02300 [Anaerolineae bacterium]
MPLLGENFYCIENYDAIEPFFMSVVSSSDHWLFISSTGSLTAGRRNAEHALFPYYTVDKLTENSENTGHKAILLVGRDGHRSLWEPFSDRWRGSYRIQRSLYKNVSGTALVFEEVNHDLELVYRYAWRTSERFGFVRTTWLSNVGTLPAHVTFLDGVQNVMPAGATSATQQTFSVLLDAYKRNELHVPTSLATFSLSSTLTDLPAPSESLLANTVMQVGLDGASYLLSTGQLEHFRTGKPVHGETDIRGRRGAYFVHHTIELGPNEQQSWHILADVDQDSAAAVENLHWLTSAPQLQRYTEVEQDIAAGALSLWKTAANADALTLTADEREVAHQFSNVMFNVMRGGIFADQYWVHTSDFADFLDMRNRSVRLDSQSFLDSLPARIQLADLKERARQHGSVSLQRLCNSFLPLTFSRRHGDPSRPWNRFDISIKKPDGSLKLDYEGNWRDIFQNWESLALSYPEAVENMIATFVNATTADGYNPYRITYRGVEWELPDPDSPWANIGYWSDHQIVYLNRLMSVSKQYHPGTLQSLLRQPVFSYVHMPYRIRPYADLLRDPRNTIEVNWELEREIEAQVRETGSDGKLLRASTGQVLHVTLTEKLLSLLLAKLANFVPEGGIWMNTQRPEWNDANNALVGKGLSVVTLAYLRPFVSIWRSLIKNSDFSTVPISGEVASLCRRIAETLRRYQPILEGTFSNTQRRTLMDELGEAGSNFRWHFYRSGFLSETIDLSMEELDEFLGRVLAYVDHSLRANKRADGLYQTYNILHLSASRAEVSPLYEMLEGQVAVLSSGILSAEESLSLLQRLRASKMYRSDQHSYILYPDRDLPGFLQKNRIQPDQIEHLELLKRLLAANDGSLVTKDVDGTIHFSGHIRNFQDVSQTLDGLRGHPDYADRVDADYEAIRALFEATFHHDEFTGRAGTFFAYEGLGSIYWHMVGKLLLAAEETVQRFRNAPAADALQQCYRDIREGFGFTKPPEVFGSFPFDAYSHTPKGQGAKQPGMTGLVKEMIIARKPELGYRVESGQIVFDMLMVNPLELLTEHASFDYLDVHGERHSLTLEADSLAYTICQTPIVLQRSERREVHLQYANGSTARIDSHTLDLKASQSIFRRDGDIVLITVSGQIPGRKGEPA